MPWGAQSKNPTRGDAGLGRSKPPKQGRSVLLPKCNWVCAAPQKGKCAAWDIDPLSPRQSEAHAASVSVSLRGLKTSTGDSVRRVGNSFLPRPHCHFELQHGPASNIAHSLPSSSESVFARLRALIPSA